MENKKKIRKHVPSSSSSSSDDDSSSSSSSSSETHRKLKHRNARKQHDSSSSSEEEVVRKSHKHQHKKSSVRKHSHSAKMKVKMLQANAKKAPKSMSPTSRHKHHLKVKLAKKAKQTLDEHDRHGLRRSRTPTRREVKKDTEHRIASPNTRIRVSVPNNRAIQDRSSRVVKDSPSTSIRSRHGRETLEEREIQRQKEREKMRRLQEEEHYKYISKSGERSSRLMQSTRMTTDNMHRHERSRSHSHGRVPIRDRLEKDYEYRRSISREHDEYPMIRSGGNQRDQQQIDRPPFDYRSDDRRIPNHEYGQSTSRIYDDRHRMNEPDQRGGRMYEGNSSNMNRSWDGPPHERKRIPDERQSWNDGPAQHDKWNKDKDPQEWKRGPSWKDQGQVPSQVNPAMPHPRRWPAPNQMSDSWSPRSAPPSHQQPYKMDPHSSSSTSGPPFKPRASPHFGFKRFPYKRFPNQYSKINFPSKRVLPSTSSMTSATTSSNQDAQNKSDDNLDTAAGITVPIVKSSSSSSNEQAQQSDNLGNESGEITTEAEEEKIAQPDTTFSGNADAQYQEECEGNLSEFSDVDDEILNREEIEESSSSRMDVHIQSQSSCTTTASRAHNRIAYVNNRIFSPFSSDYYCIYGLLPRHADDDGKCELARAEQAQKAEQNEICQMEEQAQDPSEQKMISKIHANKELKKEMDLDFEEISDGELEQELAIKGFGDALGVDWASLAKESHRPLNKSTEEFYNAAKSRLTAHRILWDIGVSVKFGGEEFARNTLIEARNELRREKQEWRLKKKELIKNEKISLNGDIKQEKLEEIDIKMEPQEFEDHQKDTENNENDDDISDDQEDFELDNCDVLEHPLAQVQVLMRKLAIKRKNLILNSTGKYGRALSARKDLKLRRQLYNLPTKDLLIDRSCTKNTDIIKNVEEIYRKLVDEVN